MSGPTPASRVAAMPIGAIVAGIGGLLAVVQVLLVWEQVSVGAALKALSSELGSAASANGIDENGGKIVLVLGVIAVALVAAWVMKVRVRNSALLITVVGVLITLVAVANFMARSGDVNTFNQNLSEIKGFVDTSGTSYSIGIGIYAAIAGGVLVVVGGILGLVRKDG